MKEKHLSITRLAILRTMGSLHKEPLRYDLESLMTIITSLTPDLLCADITRETWENGNLAMALPEVGEALAPAIALTDTVLVPIAPDDQQIGTYKAQSGWRSRLSGFFDRMLRWGQRVANGPEAIHGIAFQLFCHTICGLEEFTWTNTDRTAYRVRTQALADNIIRTIQRDPGGRVLVVVQCQWHHSLEPLLKAKTDLLEIVDYQEL
jgi:hypothetical protein